MDNLRKNCSVFIDLQICRFFPHTYIFPWIMTWNVNLKWWQKCRTEGIHFLVGWHLLYRIFRIFLYRNSFVWKICHKKNQNQFFGLNIWWKYICEFFGWVRMLQTVCVEFSWLLNWLFCVQGLYHIYEFYLDT